MIRRLKVKRGWDAATTAAEQLLLECSEVHSFTYIVPRHSITVRSRGRFGPLAKYKLCDLLQRHHALFVMLVDVHLDCLHVSHDSVFPISLIVRS